MINILNKGFVKLSILFGVVLGLVAFAGYLVSARNVEAQPNGDNHEEVCYGDCPTVKWTYYYCPEGYLPHRDSCRKLVFNGGPRWEYTDKVEGDTFNVTYLKSEDPSKCHQPSVDQLKDTYEMSRAEAVAFTQQHEEWLKAEVVECEESSECETLIKNLGDEEFREGWTNRCYESPENLAKCTNILRECEVNVCRILPEHPRCQPEKTPVCTDEGATNYGGEDGKFDERTETSDNKLCTYNTHRWCLLNEDEVTYTAIAVPDNEENPKGKPWETGMDAKCEFPSEPEVPVEQPRGTTEAGAPQCTDSTPLVLPSNVHVIRGDNPATPEVEGMDTATVNFFTSSSNANIYFKEVSASDWQHSARDIVVTGGYVSYVIRDLNPALGYTFGIQAANSCAGGETVVAVVVDGPASTTFPLNYWEWLN